MKVVTFEDVVDMFQQLKYTNIKEIDAGIYSAKNPWGEEREFCTIFEDNAERIISRRNLIEAMKQHKDIQTFEMEFTSDKDSHKVYIDDFVFGKDFRSILPIEASQTKDIFYK